jgi:predicted lipoprotein with Yx(FWY)xxD motif
MFKLRNLVLVLCLLLLLTVPALAQGPLVTLSSSDELGSFLVGPNGMTLYSFTPDPLNETVCYNRCAEAWPPLLVKSADELTMGDGIPGTLSTIERTDGTLQAAYNGIALYYWFRDEKPGDTTGHRVGHVWWIVPPATVYPQRIANLGTTLVGPGGMTLYMFKKDEPGKSNCVDNCATNWPPLTVESADAIVPGVNLLGEIGSIERADGSIQVTYNGWPLYYWKDDKAIGDATGEGVGDAWYTVAPETVGLGNSADLGDFLVANSGMTLYMFENDTEGASNCVDDCAQNWPPLTVPADERLVASAGISGELGTIKRADDSLQVTYKGMPLYYFKDDKVPGDTVGQGAGDVWYVVAP